MAQYDAHLVEQLKRVGRIAAEDAVSEEPIFTESGRLVSPAERAQFAVNCFTLAKMMQDGDDQ